MGTNKIQREKAKWEQHNNDACCLKKIMESGPHKNIVLHHFPPILKTIQVKRTRKARQNWRSKDEPINEVVFNRFIHIDVLVLTDQLRFI